MPKSRVSPLSKNIRYLLCKRIFKKCGKSVNIERGAYFGSGKDVEIGDFSGVGIFCRIHNNTVIGRNVMMGPYCYFLESTHRFDKTSISMKEQGRYEERVKVIIEDDIWMGREVMIIGNKITKEGTILGARTVLTKNFPEYSIVGGNPSRLIRSRK